MKTLKNKIHEALVKGNANKHTVIHYGKRIYRNDYEKIPKGTILKLDTGDETKNGEKMCYLFDFVKYSALDNTNNVFYFYYNYIYTTWDKKMHKVDEETDDAYYSGYEYFYTIDREDEIIKLYYATDDEIQKYYFALNKIK